MKKYITLAALLAAGTTFANAETPTVVWDLDFESDGVAIKVADGVATNLGTGVGSNGLISGGAITLNNNSFSFTQTAGNLSYADEFSLVVTVALGASQPGSWPAIFGLGETDNWCWKPSFYVATGTFNLDKDGFGGVVDETYRPTGILVILCLGKDMEIVSLFHLCLTEQEKSLFTWEEPKPVIQRLPARQNTETINS